MSENKYDVVIIGGGPASIEAAYYLRKNKKKFLIISNSELGGRATWNSLVPSKILLEIANNYNALKKLNPYGFEVNKKINFDEIRNRIKKASREINEYFNRKLKPYIIYGTGFIEDTNIVRVETKTGETKKIETEYIIIATGSKPRFLPEVKPNKKRIIAPKLFPTLNEIPETFAFIGAGVTNMEFAYAYASLGSKVTVYTNSDEILNGFDKEIVRSYRKTLENLYGIKFKLKTPVNKVIQEGEKVIVNDKDSYDYAFIAMGRLPDLTFYDDKNIPLEKTKDGFIKTNEYSQTSINNIYAIGDVTGNPMNVTKAYAQARTAAMHIIEPKLSAHKKHIPIAVVYTNPAIISVGDTNSESTIKFEYTDIVKRAIIGENVGEVKLFLEGNEYKIVGATAYGYEVEEVINIITLAIHQKIPFYELSNLDYAHPTFAERLRKVK